MKQLFSHRGIPCCILALALLAAGGDGELPPGSSSQQRFDALTRHTQSKPLLVQLRTYVDFLKLVDDDPEDLIKSQVERRIVQLEQGFLAIQSEHRKYYPDHILHCASIDRVTSACRGPTLDNSLLSNEETISSPRLLSLPPSGHAAIQTPNGYNIEIISVLAGERSELQSGATPLKVPMKQKSFAVSFLNQWKSPVVIVIFRRADHIGLRKAVWLF